MISNSNTNYVIFTQISKYFALKILKTNLKNELLHSNNLKINQI